MGQRRRRKLERPSQEHRRVAASAALQQNDAVTARAAAAAAAIRQMAVVFDELQNRRKRRHRRLLMRIAVQSEATGRFRLGDPYGRRSARRLDAQRVSEATVGTVPQQKRTDGRRLQKRLGGVVRQVNVVEITRPDRLFRQIPGRRFRPLTAAKTGRPLDD